MILVLGLLASSPTTSTSNSPLALALALAFFYSVSPTVVGLSCLGLRLEKLLVSLRALLVVSAPTEHAESPPSQTTVGQRPPLGQAETQCQAPATFVIQGKGAPWDSFSWTGSPSSRVSWLSPRVHVCRANAHRHLRRQEAGPGHVFSRGVVLSFYIYLVGSVSSSSNPPVRPEDRTNTLPWQHVLLSASHPVGRRSQSWPSGLETPHPVSTSRPSLLFSDSGRADLEKDANKRLMLEVIGSSSSTSVVLE